VASTNKKNIPAEKVFKRWRKEPAYAAVYESMADEFALAETLIQARANAGLTQEQLAKRMRTTQAVIARLESGRTKPSTRTLERLATASPPWCRRGVARWYATTLAGAWGLKKHGGSFVPARRWSRTRPSSPDG
jgi:DNA-binding XRE family transcriptional regulator